MRSKHLPVTIPASLYKFFWDVDPKKVNPEEKPHYVISRLLDKGDLDAARWVLRRYPKDVIAETLRVSRNLSSETATFWATYLGVPIEEVICMKEPYRSVRKQLWPY